MRLLALPVALSMGLAGQAVAADLPSHKSGTRSLDPTEFEARWEGSVYTYGWLSAMNGESGLDGYPPVSFDISFEEFLKHLDGYFAAIGELRRGRFGVVADLFYSDVSDSVTGPLGILDATASTAFVMATLMGEYRVWEQQKSSVDVMAGARLWVLDAKLDVKVGGEHGFNDGDVITDDQTWLDPMIGVKTRLQGDSRFYLSGWAMIGGFGASSNIDWDVFAGVGYEFRENMSILAGYRAIGVDYVGDDFLFNVIQHGPMIGGVLEF